MKGQKSALLFILAILCLVAIGAVLTSGFLKNKPQEEVKPQGQKVLGEEVSVSTTQTPVIDVNKFIKDKFQDTKSEAAQKVTEVQKTIISTVEKEISNMAQSQVTVLKEQICRDWGVISPIPTKTP